MSLMFALQGSGTAELEAGTRLLGGLYQIEEPLQQGGFALTYVARDSLDRHVVIKECFPAEICERRDGLVQARSPAVEAQFNAIKKQFLREARGVANLKHPDVVAVHQVFEENNTAYMALDYVAGMDLISVLEDEPERLNAKFIETTLIGTLKALRHIHSNGIIHRDIAPDNIRVDGSDRITLIDFGAAGARGAKSGANDGSVPSVKDGYSPPEFYGIGETQDISSDLYALGATFHHLITGEVPPDGPTRRAALAAGQPDPYRPLADGNWPCGFHVLVAVDIALNFRREDRPQTADFWLEMMESLPKEKPVLADPIVFDPMLDETIGALVRDVNTHIAASPPAPRKQSRRRILEIAKGDPIVLQVGGTGQPIIEVRAINAGYDAMTARDDVSHDDATATDADPPPETSIKTPARRSFFSALFSRYLPKDPESCPS